MNLNRNRLAPETQLQIDPQFAKNLQELTSEQLHAVEEYNRHQLAMAQEVAAMLRETGNDIEEIIRIADASFGPPADDEERLLREKIEQQKELVRKTHAQLHLCPLHLEAIRHEKERRSIAKFAGIKAIPDTRILLN